MAVRYAVLSLPMWVAASVKDTDLLSGAGVAVTLAAVFVMRRLRVLARVRWAIGW